MKRTRSSTRQASAATAKTGTTTGNSNNTISSFLSTKHTTSKASTRSSSSNTWKHNSSASITAAYGGKTDADILKIDGSKSEEDPEWWLNTNLEILHELDLSLRCPVCYQFINTAMAFKQCSHTCK
eukprot:GEZU01007845.1.p1 GENE.GEZU01007845.1~~GEZU01007845.1.p1  ORF type:complete len:126 (-),score=15.04 GEZU01007845.1:157-534(-)